MSESVLVVWSEELLKYDLGASHPMAPVALRSPWRWPGTSA